MSIKKQFLKNKTECKVTFKFEGQENLKPETVKVVGDFNNWDEDTTPMKALKGGVFTHTINLESDKQYQFRYLVNDCEWYNDEEADDYANAGLGNQEHNSILKL